MVKIIIPHRIKTPATRPRSAHHSSVVSIAFREQIDVPVEFLGLAVNGCPELFQECWCGEIHNRVNRVEAEGIYMEIGDPLQRILDEVSADLIAPGLVEIDRLSPRRLVEIREIRTEIRQVISLRTNVVVNHVEHYRDSVLMACVDECF